MLCNVVNRKRDANRSKEADINSSAANGPIAAVVQENGPPPMDDDVGDVVGDVLLSQRACIDDALQAIRTEFLEHDS